MTRVENFLKTFSSPSTVRVYRWVLTEFFKNVYGGDEGRLEEHAERYFMEQRNFEEDIQSFLAAVKDKPPKTVKLALSTVRTFLVENDVELPEKFWRRLRRRVKGARALTMDKVPSNAELRQIIMHMPIQGKALFLALASSGMRIGECLQLKLGDIDLEADPPRVNIRGEYTKTGNPRVAFISREAAEALREWLKVRSQYLCSAAGKSHRYAKPKDDQRLFPFENVTAYMVWRNALKKSGYQGRDASTNRHVVHPHVLRKFFRTKMGSVIPVDVTEAIMGHEGYLTEVYRRYSLEDLARFYRQGEASVTVFALEDVSRLHEELQQQREQLQAIVNGLARENMEMRERVKTVEKEIVELKRAFEELRETHLKATSKLAPDAS
jgi:integrase